MDTNEAPTSYKDTKEDIFENSSSNTTQILHKKGNLSRDH